MRRHIITERPKDNPRATTLKIIDSLKTELEETKKELQKLKMIIKDKEETEWILIRQIKYLNSKK